MTQENPLGKSSPYPLRYSPDVLFAVPRAAARDSLSIGPELPFRGQDIWNAWELTWLDPHGKPVVATAIITVNASSANIIESKSLKLYLNSLAMTRYASTDAVQALIATDLSEIADDIVMVNITTATNSTADSIREFSGTCIDELTVTEWSKAVDPDVLTSDLNTPVREELFSHLLRSNCPVTDQPDYGSVHIRYAGPKIDRATLLQYIVSFRQHNDFHEACVERMFLNIRDRCATNRLTVYARYTRRGGLDINPFRTDTDEKPDNLRLWRQ